MRKGEKRFRLPGLTAAAFTPMREDQTLDIDRISGIAEHLVADGVSALYVLGSTGEGISLTTEERCAVAEAYVSSVAGRIQVVIQVGHNSLATAQILARHAQDIGADAISAVPPSYFKPESTGQVIACLREIVLGAPELPFYYYHIPARTGVEIDLKELIYLGADQLPSLAGIKFSDTKLFQIQSCMNNTKGNHIDYVFGVDEMLLSGLAMGIKGAVGSTYNFAAPLYLRIMACFESGDLEGARQLQAKAVSMIDIILRTCGRSGFKAMMGVIGQDCGPHRLPISTSSKKDISSMSDALEDIGFFEWGRSRVA